MKTITLPVATRPHYLKQMLDTLKENNLEGYKLYIACEPVREVINIARSIDFIETDVRYNSKVLGVRENPYRCIQQAFDDGSDFNVHLEDDIILSPDALDLANFYYEKFKDKPMTHINYGMFNYDSEPEEPEKIQVIEGKFVGLGWCTFKECWNKWFKPYWFDDKINAEVWSPQTIGWDWSIAAVAKTNNLTSLQPLASRSNHIGRVGGTYCGADFHDKTFPQIIINDEQVEEYEII